MFNLPREEIMMISQIVISLKYFKGIVYIFRD